MGKIKVWISFSPWLFLHYVFFINLQMTTEWAFAFLNTIVIMFCFMYSLNIPKGCFFLLKGQYSSLQNSYFGDISLKMIVLIFLFAWFYHCHGHSLFIVSRPSSQILLNISDLLIAMKKPIRNVYLGTLKYDLASNVCYWANRKPFYLHA